MNNYTLLCVYIYTYIHTYIRTYVRMYIHTYVHKYILTYVRTYIHTYVHTYTYIHIYIHTYVHTYVHTYIHTYIYTYIHTKIYTPSSATPSDMRHCLISSMTDSNSSMSLSTSIRFFQVFGFTPLSVVTQSSSSAVQHSLGVLYNEKQLIIIRLETTTAKSSLQHRYNYPYRLQTRLYNT